MTSPAAAGPAEPIDLASLFLGPKAENADTFERLLLLALRDHVFWRRNVHPEDGFTIAEQDKRSPAFERSIDVLSSELLALLGELKAGVPFFSPRYVAHMNADLTMASMVAYFATMLYNPNNVSAEASPVTTRLELLAAEQLATMVGYPGAGDSRTAIDPTATTSSRRPWGHLTSGGTVANLEAFWVAQTLKYLPVAVRGAADAAALDGVAVELPTGERADVRALDLWRLLNVAPSAALDLTERFVTRLGDPARAQQLIDEHSLAGLGAQVFGRRLTAHFGDALLPAVVLVPSTAHYSWEKICRALGIGSQQLVHVPVDDRFRMDPSALAERLADCARRHQPVLACVGVVGTTEEGAVDRLDKLAAVRRDAAREHGLAFHLHADAAWGGYAIAITRGADGSRRSFEATLAAHAPEAWPEQATYDALCAVAETDSVTIDPHKFGYVPYPAGAVLFRDGRAKELVAIDAPYVFHGEHGGATTIGRYILEGSKPGAAAAAVWMSHQVLPLDERGYGRLIGETAKGAIALHRRLAAGDWAPFRLVPLPRPDLNIVCFALGHPSLATLEATNAFVERLYRRMSAVGDRPGPQVDFFVSKTTLRAAEYGAAANPIVAALGFSAADYDRAGGIAVVRCTVMDPFLAARRGKVDFVEAFATTLRRELAVALAE